MLNTGEMELMKKRGKDFKYETMLGDREPLIGLLEIVIGYLE